MKRWIVLPAVAVIVALAVACGGDDSPPTPTATPEATPTATEAPATPTATPEPTPTATPEPTPTATPEPTPEPTATADAAVAGYLSRVCEPQDVAIDDATPVLEALAHLEGVRDRWYATTPPEGLGALHDLSLSTIDGVVRIVGEIAGDNPDGIYEYAHWAAISAINVYADLVREAYVALPPDVRAQFEDRGCEPLAGVNIAELDEYLSHVCSLTGLEVSSATPLDEAVAEYQDLRVRWRETVPPDVLLERHEVSLAMLDGVIRALDEAVADPERATFGDAHDAVFDAMLRYRDLLVEIDYGLPDPVVAEFIAMGCSTRSIPLARPSGSDLSAVDEYLSHVCGLSGLTLGGDSPLEEAVSQYQAMRERWRATDPPEALLEHKEVSLAMVDAIIRVLEEAERDPEQTVLADAFAEAFAVMRQYGDPLEDVFNALPADIQNEFRVMGCTQ